MFTVEMNFDEIEITVLDDRAVYDDVKVHIFDDVVYIRQFDDETGSRIPQAIAMTPDMWKQLLLAVNSPEGAFQVK